MKKSIVISAAIVLVSVSIGALSQTTTINGGRTIVTGGTWDASLSASSSPMKVALSAPVTCSVGQFYFNSTSLHTFACTAINTWTQQDGSGLVASGTATMGTAGIASGACATTVTVTATGTATTSTVVATANTNPTVVAGYTPAAPLYVDVWPSLNAVNFAVCNPPGGSTVNPSALTFNFKVF